MGNTIKPGEHVENVIIWENMNCSKGGIKEITNGNRARDFVKNNHDKEPSELISTVNPEKMVNKTNMNEKTKRGIMRERKGKENVLKKYYQLNVQGLITISQPKEKV